MSKMLTNDESIKTLEKVLKKYFSKKGDTKELDKMENWFEINVVYTRNWRELTIINLTKCLKEDKLWTSRFGSSELYMICGHLIGRINKEMGLPSDYLDDI